MACITGVKSNEISCCLHPVKRRFIAIDDMQADEPIGRMEASKAQTYKSWTVQGLSGKYPKPFTGVLVNDIPVFNAQSSVWRLTVLSEAKGCTMLRKG